jgi:hypothetical protein
VVDDVFKLGKFVYETDSWVKFKLNLKKNFDSINTR